MKFLSSLPVVVSLCAASAATVWSTAASAAPLAPGFAIPDALVIAKSSNRNQVHYAVQVDERCAPAGREPVSPYWRMLERGPEATEPLSRAEQRVLAVQQQVVRDDAVDISLRAVPGRVLTIHTWRAADGRCASAVDTTVAGVPARVACVYVKQGFFGGISYVRLTGVTATGTTVEERIPG